jgi:hypothetical protein
MQIRGSISVNGSSSPLIIIDGVTGSIDELNSINGNDIDNISVLKNWWIFNSFGGATTDTSDIDPATGAPRIYKGEALFNALRDGKVLTSTKRQACGALEFQ